MNTEKIHLLIHSMSSAEKRHFNQTVRGGKEAKCVQLFNAIAKQKNYEESALIKKFGYQDNLNNFSAAKTQLFKLILKSLREFSSHFGEYQKILQHLKDIEILYSRGLRLEALKSAQKAKKIALDNVWVVFQFLVEHWEQKLSDFEDSIQSVTPNLGRYIDTRLQYELLYKRIHQDNILYSSYSYHQSPNHCYPKILGHELMQNYRALSCDRSMWYFCLIKIECNRSIRNTGEAAKWAKELLRVQKNINSNGFYYEGWRLRGVFEYLHTLLDNHEIDLFLKDFHLIEDLEYPDYPKGLVLAKKRDTLLLECYFFAISDRLEKPFDKLTEEVEEYTTHLRQGYTHENDLILIVGIQYLFYSLRKDEQSTKWAMIFEQYVDPKRDIKHHIGSKIIALLSHYGLGNEMYIKNTLPNLERYIKKHNRQTPEYVFLFRLLNKLQGVQTKKEKANLIRDFKADMKALQKTNRKRYLLSAQSLMIWADSCLSKTSFLDINRQLFAPELP